MEYDMSASMRQEFEKFRGYLLKRVKNNKQYYDLTSTLIRGDYNRITNSYIGINTFHQLLQKITFLTIYIIKYIEKDRHNGQISSSKFS